VWGDAVNVASRMESTGLPGRIQVSGEAYKRLEDDFAFESRGPVMNARYMRSNSINEAVKVYTRGGHGRRNRKRPPTEAAYVQFTTLQLTLVAI
jgi:class 3 adenylate cyclase